MSSNNRRKRYRHALSVVVAAASVLAQSTTWDEFIGKGEEAIAKGQYGAAEQYLSAAPGELQGVPQSDRRWATTFNTLGTAKYYLGDFEVAAAFFQKALRIWEHVAGEEQGVADILYNLGQTQCEQAKYRDAELSLKRSLAINKNLRPESSIRTATVLNWLGIVYIRQAKYNEAELSLTEAFRLLRRAQSNQSDFAHCLNSMAELRIARDDPKSAELLLQQVLRIYEEQLGPDHPTTTITLSNLAGFYLRQGRLERAEPLLKKAVRIQEQTFGPQHPQLAGTLKDLGFLYGLERRFGMAESLLKRALAIEEKTLGIDHPHMAVTLNQLSLIYINQGKYTSAEPLLERAVALVTRSPALVREAARNGWQLVYSREGRFGKAELSYQQAIELWEKTVRPDDPSLLPVLREYLALVRRNRRPEVRELKNRIKAIKRKKGSSALIKNTLAFTNPLGRKCRHGGLVTLVAEGAFSEICPF
jgi:tetratricopeptide (TPR) repeat protein